MILTGSSLNKKGKPSSHWTHLKFVLGHDIPALRCNKHHTTYIKYLQKRTPNGERYIDFLRSKRIELNTIINEVGAERFWEWIKSQLLEQFPNRDYNRAITVPNYVLTPTIREFIDKLGEALHDVSKYKVREIKHGLDGAKGLLETDKELGSINKTLLNLESEHPLVKEMDGELDALTKRIDDYYEDGDSP